MEETLMNANASKPTKIKTHYARIVVGGKAEKPCYSIEWYDPLKKEYNLGYSSYYIGYVFNWLSEYFEIVDKDINVLTNADRIRAMSDEELAEFLVVANPTNCLDCAFSCGWRCQPDRQDYSDTEKCLEGKKRWLKQTAE